MGCLLFQSIIYYAVSNSKLEDWINSPLIREALLPIKDKNFVDLDPVFNMNIDEDYDYRYSGITRNSFCSIYVNWIRYCNGRREKVVNIHSLCDIAVIPLYLTSRNFSACSRRYQRFTVSDPMFCFKSAGQKNPRDCVPQYCSQVKF